MSRPTAVDNLEQRLQRKSQNINTNHKYINKGDNISWLMEIHPPLV
jgi:hypothetical protein